jgi:hypothetical protein
MVRRLPEKKYEKQPHAKNSRMRIIIWPTEESCPTG